MHYYFFSATRLFVAPPQPLFHMDTSIKKAVLCCLSMVQHFLSIIVLSLWIQKSKRILAWLVSTLHLCFYMLYQILRVGVSCITFQPVCYSLLWDARLFLGPLCTAHTCDLVWCVRSGVWWYTYLYSNFHTEAWLLCTLQNFILLFMWDTGGWGSLHSSSSCTAVKSELHDHHWKMFTHINTYQCPVCL